MLITLYFQRHIDDAVNTLIYVVAGDGKDKAKTGDAKDRGRFSVFGVLTKPHSLPSNSKDREPSPVFACLSSTFRL